MSLIELKKHLQQVKIATLSGLSALFKKDPATLKPLLDFWVRKGELRHCKNPNPCATPCASCIGCGVNKQDYYEWVFTIDAKTN